MSTAEADVKGILDFVITVCDQAREACPIWPGQPIVAHWGVDDPAAFVGSAEGNERVFAQTAMLMHRRVQLFTSLPLEKLDRLKVESLTKEIGTDQANASAKGADK